MRLQKLCIKNFRAIGADEDGNGVELEFDKNNVIFLCGPNNSGKSTILYAYEMFVIAKKTSALSDFYQESTENNIEIEAWVKSETEEDREHRALSLLWDSDGIARIRKTWSEIGGVGAKESYDPENGWQAGGAGGFDTLLQSACPSPVWIKGATTPEEVVSLLETLVQETILKQLVDKPVYQEAIGAVQRLETAIRDDQYTSDLKEHLNDAITRVFPSVSFDIKNEGERDITDLFKKKTSVAICEDGRPDLDFVYHGHGVRRQFILSAFRGLASQLENANKTPKQRASANFDISGLVDEPDSPKSRILLIEEPELYLHPQSMRSVKELVYLLGSASEFQVLAATHAPIMVDLSKPHSTLVRCVCRPGGGVATSQVSSDLFEPEERDHMKMLNYFDPYVCEAFFSEEVLLVEGDTECVAVRNLKNRMVNEPGFEDLRQLHVVNCGTKNNIPFFQKILTYFGIPYWVFHDLDSRLTEAGNASSAWTLNGRIWTEIENSATAGVSASRFVFNTEFESDNGYEYNSSVGKPYSAFIESKAWALDDETRAAVKYLRVIAGKSELDREFDDAYVEELG